MHLQGVIIGLAAFLIIGIFHPIVIKGEYHFTTKIWPLFLIAGIAFIVASIMITQLTLSAIFAILGFTCLWSINELFEQRKRVEKGWFPAKTKDKE